MQQHDPTKAAKVSSPTSEETQRVGIRDAVNRLRELTRALYVVPALLAHSRQVTHEADVLRCRFQFGRRQRRSFLLQIPVFKASLTGFLNKKGSAAWPFNASGVR